MHPKFPVLTTDRLTLRMATAADAPSIVRYFRENAEHLAASHPLWPDGFFTEEFWERRAELDAMDFEAGRSLRLFVFEKSGADAVIGSVHLSGIVRGSAQFCYLGYNIAAAKQGRGLMTEALAGTIAYAFDEMALHRIMANYVPANEASASVLRKLGFTVEGYARDYLCLDGVWQDHVLTALINPQPA